MDPKFIKALGSTAGLAIPEDRLQGVADSFAVTMRMASGVMAAELPLQALENAPVFDAWAKATE
jgi:hypothetical protein